MAEPVRSSELGAFAGIRVARYDCHFGPSDRPFEEQHRKHNVAFVLSGTFLYRVDRRPVALVPGALMLGNAGRPYTCSHEHGHGDRCLSISYDQAVVEDVAAAVGVLGFDSPSLAPHARATALAHLLLGQGAPTASGEEIAYALLVFALRGQARGGAKSAPVTHAHMRRALEAAALLEERPDEVWSLDALAAQAGVSPFYFLRSFRQALGMTPHQYLVQARLRRAVVALLETRAAITDIALAAGFSDLANFNRSFKQTVGCSPRRLRDGALSELRRSLG